MSKTKKLYRTMIIVWTEKNPQHKNYSLISWKVAEGVSAYCTKQETKFSTPTHKGLKQFFNPKKGMGSL